MLDLTPRECRSGIVRIARRQPMLSTHDNGDAALAAFLLEHLGHVEHDDVGPWIGQAAWLCERGDVLLVGDDVQRVVNVALAGQPTTSSSAYSH